MDSNIPSRYLAITALLGFGALIFAFIPGSALFIIMLLYLLLEIVIAIVYSGFVKKASTEDDFKCLCYWNIRLRIVHGALVLVPLAFALFMGNIFHSGLTLLVFSVTFLPYLVGQLLALIPSIFSCRRSLYFAVQNRKCSLDCANMHIVLHFVPFVDIYSAIAVYRKLFNG
jgi:hypothetical protein